MLKFFIMMLSCVMVAMAMGDDDESLPPAPDFCSVLPSTGTGRATHSRFRFNAETNQCEFFIWKGGPPEDNIFLSKEECEATCKRDDDAGDDRDFQLTCEFSSNLGRVCNFEEIEPDDLGFCMGQEGANMTEETCVEFGCCWFAGLCFQKRSDLVRSSCVIHQNSRTRFWGKVVFQADADTGTWLGSLSFNSPIDGDFCIVRSGKEYAGIEPGSLEDRQTFTLPGRSVVVSGELISIVFMGRTDPSSIAASQCSAISRGRNTAGVGSPGK